MAYLEGESHPCATTPPSRRGLIGAGLGTCAGFLAGTAWGIAARTPQSTILGWLVGVPAGLIMGAMIGIAVEPQSNTPTAGRTLTGAGLGAGVCVLAGIAWAVAFGYPPFFLGDAHTFGFDGRWLMGIPGPTLAGALLGALTGPRR